MPKLITASYLILLGIFYEMSGGADFEPRERVILTQAPFAQPGRNTTTVVPVSTAPTVVKVAFVPVQTETLAPTKAVLVQQSVAVVTKDPAPQTPVVAPATFHYVAGDRVNLRAGPGTGHAVLDTLTRGVMAQVIATNDGGWAQIRLVETDQTGWMAMRLLSNS